MSTNQDKQHADAATEVRTIEAIESEVPHLPHLPITKSRAQRRMAIWKFKNRHIPVDQRRPMWRGWLHAGTFPLAVASGIVLITLSQGVATKFAAAVFMLTSLLLFGNSALYHRFNWKPRTKLILKRIDHANIVLLIAGTYTPLAVTCLSPTHAKVLLILVWSGALATILFRVFWITAPRWLYVVIYLALGWAAMMFIVELFNASAPAMWLVLAGGLCYSLGAVVYAIKRPNPVPNVFGFHEIFHALTVLAFACHAVAMFIICLQPPAM